MIKSKIPIKKMRERDRRLRKSYENNMNKKIRLFRQFIMKLEKGNEGKGYSSKNIMTSYYSQKITGINA